MYSDTTDTYTTMKRIILYLLFFITGGIIMPAAARVIFPVAIDSVRYDREGNNMVFSMNVDLSATDIQSTRAQILTPIIASDTNRIELTPIGVYGRRRYINYQRNGCHPLGASDEKMYRAKERPSALGYEQSVAWQPWMDDSEVLIRRSVYGCVDCLIEERTDTIIGYFRLNPAIPEIVYFPAPAQGPKMETLEGEAFIDFVVDKTDIRPSYRNNVRELGKIQASIDTVLNDPDVRITGVWLKGFASPESPYSHNRDLAMGRTDALKNYIGQLYRFSDGIIETAFEPEDWEGLRRYVDKSNIDHREEILALIDSDMEPDAKEAKIKRTFPKEYRFMLENWYPALRHTNYRITYEISRFDDVDKIRQVMQTRPSRLSLREFFILGSNAEPGSDEFNEVFETAVRMYPDNEIANINAANAALQRGDYTTAERYLERAGQSPQAIYARGALAFLRGDYDTAERLMNDAKSIEASQSTLDEIQRIRNHKQSRTIQKTLE